MRNKEQVMGYWLNEPSIADPSRVRKAMCDLARAGYGIVRIMLRNTNFTHRSPRVVEAIAEAVQSAHRKGMRVVLDCEPHATPLAGDMGEAFPDAMGARLIRAQTTIVNGTFQARAVCSQFESQMPVFSGVEAAFLKNEGRLEKTDEFQFDLRWEMELHKDGACRAEHHYQIGAVIDPRRTCLLHGHIDAPAGSQLILYIKLADSLMVDFWAPGFREYFDLLLECYREVPLDGVCWDEPAVAGSWDHYRYGEAFACAFEKANGYRLADQIWLLDDTAMSAAAARTRLDYYRTLNEGVYLAQRNFIERARSLFGPDLLLGTHHTWHGEGNHDDYRAGAVDYFRLNDNMDAGYTDCCWWDMGSVYYAYVLASSLGRLAPSGEAECNTWHCKPTNAQVSYHVRLMTLMNIIWFNIWYGDNADTCQYPAHYTWAATTAGMRKHLSDLRLLGNVKPVVEMAIWHGWEGICALNRADIAAAQKTFCINISELLTERNISFDFIDSRLVENASIEGNEMVTRLGSYRVLVMPYAMVMPRAVWETILDFASSGGKLIFVGPPPEMDEFGRPLGEEFAKLFGMPPLPVEEYLCGVDSACVLPKNRQPTLDISYPLTGDADRLLVSSEDEPHGIRGRQDNLLYLTDLDPRMRLTNLLEVWLVPEVQCFSDSIQWRLYREGERSVLVCIARKDRQMSGLIRFAGQKIEMKRGLLAVIEMVDGDLRIFGEDLEWTIRTSERSIESSSLSRQEHNAAS